MLLPVAVLPPNALLLLAAAAIGLLVLLIARFKCNAMKEYFGMTIAQTFKTWTVVETGIAVVAIGVILLVNALVSQPT